MPEIIHAAAIGMSVGQRGAALTVNSTRFATEATHTSLAYAKATLLGEFSRRQVLTLVFVSLASYPPPRLASSS